MNFQDWLTHNQFATGGLVMMLTGAAMALARNIPARLWQFVKRQFVISLEVTNADPVFEWLTLWLHEQPYARRSRSLTVSTLRAVGGASPVVAAETDEDRLEATRIIFSPARGDHFFIYKSRLLWLSRDRSQESTPASSGTSFLRREETFLITLLGHNQSVIRELIEDARARAVRAQQSRVNTYVSTYGYWRSLGQGTSRPLQSVILPEGLMEKARDDVKKFLASRKWYAELGIPYHRGYLLHGLPGSGKTSLVCGLASELKLNLYLLNIAGSGMNDERLADLVMNIQPRSILLMEDVDATIRSREGQSTGGKEKGVTLSGLLNCLDGVMARDGCIVFMTTNYRDRLDPALVRPGRVDLDVEFRHATSEQIRRLHTRFHPECYTPVRDAFVNRFESSPVTMAEVQKVLLDGGA